MLNYQIVHTFKWSKGQPDPERLVRLFLDTLASRFGIFGLWKYFGMYLIEKEEAVLGSNHRNFEIRLYFIRRRESSGNVFLILALYHLNWMGILQSMYLRPFLLIILWLALRLMRDRST